MNRFGTWNAGSGVFGLDSGLRPSASLCCTKAQPMRNKEPRLDLAKRCLRAWSAAGIRFLLQLQRISSSTSDFLEISCAIEEVLESG